MSEFNIDTQLELYSNAIVGFVVIQGLGFLYKFGSDAIFSQIVQNNADVSSILIIVFLIIMATALYCNQKISRVLQRRTNANDKQLIRQIFYGKATAIVIFCSMQVYFVLVYGLIKHYSKS